MWFQLLIPSGIKVNKGIYSDKYYSANRTLLVIGAWSVASIVLINAYKGMLLSYTCRPRYGPVVNSWYDLAHRKDLRVIVGKGKLLSKYFLVHSTTSIFSYFICFHDYFHIPFYGLHYSFIDLNINWTPKSSLIGNSLKFHSVFSQFRTPKPGISDFWGTACGAIRPTSSLPTRKCFSYYLPVTALIQL